MHNKDSLTFKKDERRDSVTVGRATLSRKIFFEKSGALSQMLKVEFDGAMVDKAGALWEYKTGASDASSDDYLQTLYQHWRQLRKEFQDIMRQAQFYYYTKEKEDDSASGPAYRKFLEDIGQDLLQDILLPEELQSGTFEGSYADLVDQNAVLRALRYTSDQSSIKLDRFEDAIEVLSEQVESMSRAYDKIYGDAGLQTSGDDDSDEQQMGSDYEDKNSGLQSTAGPYEGEEEKLEPWQADPEAWRGDQPAWREQDDVDEKRDSNTNAAFIALRASINEFIDDANSLWKNALEQIYDKERVTRDEQNLTMMEQHRKDCAMYMAEFKTQVAGTANAEFELKPLLEMLDDEKGPLQQMEGLMKIASNPAQLEAIIKK